jgi:hypothetical protein
MIMGTIDLMSRSGLSTPMLHMPTPLLAVPYAAPRSIFQITPLVSFFHIIKVFIVVYVLTAEDYGCCHTHVTKKLRASAIYIANKAHVRFL